MKANTFKISSIHWSIITVITTIVYYSIFSHDFQLQWDDQWQLINTMTSNGITLDNLQTITTTIYNGQYSPANQLYYTLLYLCFGYNSSAFHIGNLLFHILNAFLIYTLSYTLLKETFSRKKTLFISFLSALLFAVHPVQVETVCWISASKIVLSTFFYLLALIAYTQYIRSSQWKYLVCSVCSGIIAMGCKEQSVTLISCILLFDWILFKRNMLSLNVYLEKIYFLIPTIAFFIVTLISNQNSGEETIGYTVIERFLFFCYSLFKYILISAIPFKLSYLYPFPFQVGEDITLSLWVYPFIILFIGYVIFLNRKNRLIIFCTLFFLLHLLPVLHIIPLPRYVITADRYLYLPYITYAIGISALSYHLYEQYGKRILGVVLLYLSFLCFYTANYAPIWKNSDTLKEHFKGVLQKRKTLSIINHKN